ncbi:hypothetical protein BDZ89DRAFT_1086276 [Hymenopellis radicata]|nr:hypothetical protein BDZ89DRAFT_1086276 [Hymenopellis radicata]
MGTTARPSSITSIDQTLNCRDDRASFIDGGPPIYPYANEDRELFVFGEQLCINTGSIPSFLRLHIEAARHAKKATEHVPAHA